VEVVETVVVVSTNGEGAVVPAAVVVAEVLPVVHAATTSSPTPNHRLFRRLAAT
jgi:hypothetical protein